MKVKPDLGENCMLLKQVVNAFTSLSMCISSSHSSNLRLTSHETLIPNNHFVWMKKDSYGWAFALLDPWSNFFDLCRTLHALDASLSCIYASCISLYALFCFYFDLTFMSLFYVYKNPKPHKKWKIQNFDHICLSTFHMWVWPSTFVLMT